MKGCWLRDIFNWWLVRVTLVVVFAFCLYILLGGRDLQMVLYHSINAGSVVWTQWDSGHTKSLPYIWFPSLRVRYRPTLAVQEGDARDDVFILSKTYNLPMVKKRMTATSTTVPDSVQATTRRIVSWRAASFSSSIALLCWSTHSFAEIENNIFVISKEYEMEICCIVTNHWVCKNTPRVCFCFRIGFQIWLVTEGLL